MRDGNSKKSKFSWPKTLVKKWFNIKSRAEDFYADDIINGGLLLNWLACCEKEGIRKGAWTPEEDKILTDFITQNGHGAWRNLPKIAEDIAHFGFDWDLYGDW